ncbi:High-affinity nicotinic acid transporter, partial [Talaromyces pinophilus]
TFQRKEAFETSIGVVAVQTEEERIIEKCIVRRTDFMILPLVILVYLMNYIDSNNYASARLQGLETDLHLRGDQYQTGVSVMYISYILAQVPSNLPLNYCGRLSLYLRTFAVIALTSQVTNCRGFVACHFILGLVKAPFFSGVLSYLSKCMAIFYPGSLISGAFGNLIAAGIITVFFGVATCFPPRRFPTRLAYAHRERKVCDESSMALDAEGVDNDKASGMSQLLAVTDVKTWILTFDMAITGACGFQNF